jgi:methionyl-tRNA synthetase
VDAQAPWALAKDPARRQRLDTVLYTLAEALRCLGILLDPFLPEAAAKIRRASPSAGSAEVATGPLPLGDLDWGRTRAGQRVERLSGLFPRVEIQEAGPVEPGKRGGDSRREAEGTKAEAARIPIGDFARVDLRVAEIVAAEKLAKSRKLLKLTVRVGEETRTLVAGVAEHYDPAALVGRKVVVVANLEPATLMGVESNGMVLAASHGGTVSLLTLDRDVPSGAKVK